MLNDLDQNSHQFLIHAAHEFRTQIFVNEKKLREKTYEAHVQK